MIMGDWIDINVEKPQENEWLLMPVLSSTIVALTFTDDKSCFPYTYRTH